MTLDADRRRRLVAAAPAGGRLSRPVAADGRDHHPVAGPRRRGGRAADHRAGRDRDERHARRRPRSARSRSTACPTSSSPSRTAPTTTSRARRCSTGCGDLSLPDGVTPSVSPLSSPSGLIYRYVLQSPDRSPMELKTFEDWVVEPQYRSVPGVADDSGFGGGTMQYQVLLDPAKLAGGRPVGARRWRPRWPPTTPTPAAASIRRAASSTTCAASAGWRRWRTSATSCWPCTTACRCWSRTSAAW